jgi:uncharacterized protein (TIGR02678 family)
VRAEGIALLDPSGEASDYSMPEEGTDGHATLLLAEHLSGRMRRNAGALPVEHAVRYMRRLIGEHAGLWRKTAEPEPLTRLALHRLASLGLVELARDDGEEIVRPLPALARFEYLEPRIIRR